MDRKSAYKVLGLTPPVSKDDVIAAHRALAIKWHPDKHVGKRSAKKAHRKMTQINQAKDRLVNPDHRERLDDLVDNDIPGNVNGDLNDFLKDMFAAGTGTGPRERGGAQKVFRRTSFFDFGEPKKPKRPKKLKPKPPKSEKPSFNKSAPLEAQVELLTRIVERLFSDHERAKKVINQLITRMKSLNKRVRNLEQDKAARDLWKG